MRVSRNPKSTNADSETPIAGASREIRTWIGLARLRHDAGHGCCVRGNEMPGHDDASLEHERRAAPDRVLEQDRHPVVAGEREHRPRRAQRAEQLLVRPDGPALLAGVRAPGTGCRRCS